MLASLAYKHAKTHLINYLVYGSVTTLGVLLFYAFSAITHDQNLKTITDGPSLIDLLNSANVLVVLFLIFFIGYANYFFMRMRSKEIKLYLLLGIPRYKIGFIFFLESFSLGIVSLLSGLILGLIFTKLIAMLLLALMGIQHETHLFFNGPAVLQTSLTFLVVIICLGLINALLVYSYRLATLFTPRGGVGQKYVRFKWIQILSAILGFLLLGGSFIMASDPFGWTYLVGELTEFSSSNIFLGLVIILGLNVIGTFFFYRGTVLFLIQLQRRFKKSYFRGMRMLNVVSLLNRFRQNAVTLWVITVLSGIAITVIGSTVVAYSVAQQSVNAYAPNALVVAKSEQPEIDRIIKQNQIKPLATTTAHYKVFYGHYRLMNRLNGRYDHYDGPITLLPVSDYNEAAKRQANIVPLQIHGIEGQLVMSGISWVKTDQNEVPVVGKQQVKFDQNISSIKLKKISNKIPFGQTTYFGNLLVVSDDYFAKAKGGLRTEVIAYNFKVGPKTTKLMRKITKKVSMKAFQNESIKAVTKAGKISYVFGKDNKRDSFYLSRDVLTVRQKVQDTFDEGFGVIIFLATFLSLLFLTSTGAILMLKQIAEAQNEKGNYLLLKKIGVSTEEIKRAVYKQTLSIFLMPIMVGALDAIFAIGILRVLFDYPDVTLAVVTGVCFIFIFLTFYLFTAKHYNRIVNQSSD